MADVGNAATARTNLGLGSAAIKNVGTAEGQVPVFGVGGLLAMATPAKGNNSQNGATTEFVVNELGSFAGVRTVSASGTLLTDSDVGKYVVVDFAGTGTIQLPSPSALRPGSKICLSTSSIVTKLTVSSAGGKTIAGVLGPAGGGGGTSFDLGKTVYCEFVAVGSVWGVISGAGSAGLSANGYQRLPSGLIMQWGEAGAASPITVTLPVAFPHAGLMVVSQAVLNVGETPSSTTLSGVENSSLTTTQFVLRHSNAGARSNKWLAFGY